MFHQLILPLMYSARRVEKGGNDIRFGEDIEPVYCTWGRENREKCITEASNLTHFLSDFYLVVQIE